MSDQDPQAREGEAREGEAREAARRKLIGRLGVIAFLALVAAYVVVTFRWL